MNNFGGKWTAEKIEFFIKYIKAYMQILKKYPDWPLFYFDGFAGSGEISTNNDDIDLLEGVATRVLSIEEPRSFDLFYFVENDVDKAINLQRVIDDKFPIINDKHVVWGDCNKKLLSLAKFLKKPENKDYRGIVFIDPCGMQVKWESLEALKGLNVDLWILVPTGTAINRHLKKDEPSPEKWFNKLGDFFGVSAKKIKDHFYEPDPQGDLFNNRRLNKIDRAVEEAAELYAERLNTIFQHVSEPLVMRNSKNAIIFHFFLASNVKVATKIANDIVNLSNN